MNVQYLKLFLWMTLLIIVQVFFFDKLYLYGFINPMVYILFIFIYPFNLNKTRFFVLSFSLGLIIDIFQGTGGIHASASLTIAALRYPLISVLIGKDTEYADVNLFTFRNYILIIYLSILVFIHHFIVYYLDFFKISALGFVLLNTIKVGFFTFVLSFLTIKIFSLKK